MPSYAASSPSLWDDLHWESKTWRMGSMSRVHAGVHMLTPCSHFVECSLYTCGWNNPYCT